MSQYLTVGAEPAAAPANANAAAESIRAMKSSLERWLRFRRIMDDLATGKARRAALPAPGARPTPPSVLRKTLLEERFADEQPLANQLHTLLSEVMDASALPSPNVRADPDAAVKLALIAISGKLPSQAGSSSPTGIIWLWPVLIVGGLFLIVSSVVKNMADVAKEKERLRCIREGACTDHGFWLKVGSVAFIGWLVWDKFGVGAKLTGKGRRRAKAR